MKLKIALLILEKKNLLSIIFLVSVKFNKPSFSDFQFHIKIFKNTQDFSF